jgi:histone deacetylase complex regulatory component SIN3
VTYCASYSIAMEDVISRMKVLFDWHPYLILAFNEFMQEEYKINIKDGEVA